MSFTPSRRNTLLNLAGISKGAARKIACKKIVLAGCPHGPGYFRDVSFNDQPVRCGLDEREPWRKGNDAMQRNVRHNELAGLRRDDPPSRHVGGEVARIVVYSQLQL